ncbi:BgTH12-05295 [Blumeria graminis f. sp. triticale]|uniref:Queuosine 5'-phosphate N-glycosylase/hydrolase n=1 Tax=Blumeria graminis f. sp. triticale TaxID=1689686 RepID=A0A9W4D161_BLUGR|nr:BgTH12-05295 [Blumeria graminis f. sp. triticale]
MSDPELDTDLLQFLQQHYYGNSNPSNPETKVLEGAEYVYNNAIDVALNLQSTRATAAVIHDQMQKRNYSTKTWTSHELHPKAKDESTVDFIFTMDLLNFSFWSDKTEEERFSVDYRNRKWTGYWSLVAALQRALDEDIPITSPEFWVDDSKGNEEILKHVFRSATQEEIPLYQERVSCLREAGKVLVEKYDSSFVHCIEAADHSAAALVNLLAREFPSFKDEVSFENRKSVRFLKRAQICVADLWAAFDGEQFGSFKDIDQITIFADYRIPQILKSYGCLSYSPPLENTIRNKQLIKSGHSWEIQLRGCSIWCVEMIRREILKNNPSAKINAVLIDFFLYDLAKEREATGHDGLPHHRTRCIWY